MNAIPTFDEWYEARHSFRFDEVWGSPNTPIREYNMALSRELRAYVSEIVSTTTAQEAQQHGT